MWTESLSVWWVSPFQRHDSAVMRWGGGGVVVVQQAAIFSCTISCSIIVPWITSIAGDNRQAAERTGWYRTPTPVWEAVWIISCLPADCLWGPGASDGWKGVYVGRGIVCTVTQFDFTGRQAEHRVSGITSMSHSSYFVLCINPFLCSNPGFLHHFQPIWLIIYEYILILLVCSGWRITWPQPPCRRSSNTCWQVLHVCMWVCKSQIRIKQEPVALLSATQYAGFFVNGGIMEEGDTWFKHD